MKPVPGPGLGVWWEPGGPPAAPQYLVEWAEVGAGGGLDWLRCPPGAHSTLLPGERGDGGGGQRCHYGGVGGGPDTWVCYGGGGALGWPGCPGSALGEGGVSHWGA